MYAHLNMEEHKTVLTQKIEYVTEKLEENPIMNWKESKEVLQDVLNYIENNL